MIAFMNKNTRRFYLVVHAVLTEAHFVLILFCDLAQISLRSVPTGGTSSDHNCGDNIGDTPTTTSHPPGVCLHSTVTSMYLCAECGTSQFDR